MSNKMNSASPEDLPLSCNFLILNGQCLSQNWEKSKGKDLLYFLQDLEEKKKVLNEVCFQWETLCEM